MLFAASTPAFAAIFVLVEQARERRLGIGRDGRSS